MLVLGKIKICIKITSLIFIMSQSNYLMYWDQREAQQQHCIRMHQMGKYMEITLTAGEMQKHVEKTLYDFNTTETLWPNVPV